MGSDRLGDLIIASGETDLKDLLGWVNDANRISRHALIDKTTESTAVDVILAAIPLLFALVHFSLFLFYRKKRENLYFAAFSSCLGLAVSPLNSGILIDLVLSISSGVFGLRLMYLIFLSHPSRIFWPIFFSVCGLGILEFLFPAFIGDDIIILIFFIETLRISTFAIIKRMEARDDLQDLFTKLNRSLCRNLNSRTFICFAMGELDTTTHLLRLSNGGCPYPLHFQASSKEITELQIDAYPLGIHPDTSYQTTEAQLQRDDFIIFCSDGIIEAENGEGEIYGFERTAETIRQGCSEGLSAEALIDHLIGAVKEFAGETPQGDDMTVVVLKVGE